MTNVNLAQKLKDLFFGQPGNPKSIKNANTNPPSDAEIIALLSQAGEPFKVLTGLLTGHATTPTFTVLQNEIDADISSISRNGAGDYDINVSASVFTADKTHVLITPQGTSAFRCVVGSRKDANSVQVKMTIPEITDATIAVTDGQITDSDITVTDGQITNSAILVDQGPPVTAAITDGTIAGGTAVMVNAAIDGGTAVIGDAATKFTGTDTGVLLVEIRIYNS